MEVITRVVIVGLDENVWPLTMAPVGPAPILVIGVKLRPRLQAPRQFLTTRFTVWVPVGLFAAFIVRVSRHRGRLKLEVPVNWVMSLFLLLMVANRLALDVVRKLVRSPPNRLGSPIPR